MLAPQANLPRPVRLSIERLAVANLHTPHVFSPAPRDGWSYRGCREAAARFMTPLGGLAAGLWLLVLPGALRALRFGHVSSFHPIVDVAIADRAQRFVVQADLPSGFAQLFREFVQRFQVVGGGRDFGFGGLEEFLVSLVDQARDLAAYQ